MPVFRKAEEPIYPGFITDSIPSYVTGDEMKTLVVRCVGNDPSLYVNDEPVVAKVEAGDGNCFFVVRGVLLPLLELKRKLKMQSIAGRPVTILDVDLGFPRNAKGELGAADFVLHNHMKEAYGHVRPCNIIDYRFCADRLGHMLAPPRELVFDGSPDDTNDKVVGPNDCLLWFRKLKSSPDAEKEDMLLFKFEYALAAIQALLYYNMDEKLNPKRRPFLMPNRHVSKNMRIREVSAACPAYYGRGLGVKGRRLNVKKLAEDERFIPWDEFDQSVLYEEKIRIIKEKAVCDNCHERFQILGISPDLVWLAALCLCDPATSPLAWPNEDFFRLAVTAFFEDATSRHGRIDGSVKTPVAILLPGIKVPCTDVDEVKKVAGAVTSFNHIHENNVLFSQQTVARQIMASFEIEEGEDGLVHHSLLVAVSASEVWSCEGSSKIGGVTLVSKFVADDGICGYSSARGERRIGARLCRITDACDRISHVLLRVRLPKGESVRDLEPLMLIPKARSTAKNQLKKVMAHWKNYEQSMIGDTVLAQVHEWFVLRDHAFTRDGVYVRFLTTITDPSMMSVCEFLLPHCYVGLDCFFRGMYNKITKDPVFNHPPLTGRVWGRCNIDGGIKIDILVKFPTDIQAQTEEFRFRPWIVHTLTQRDLLNLIPAPVPEPVPHLVGRIPGGMEREGDEEFDLGEDEDIIHEDDIRVGLANAKAWNLERRQRSAAQPEWSSHAPCPALCFYDATAGETTQNLTDSANFITRPVVDRSLLNLLLRERPCFPHSVVDSSDNFLMSRGVLFRILSSCNEEQRESIFRAIRRRLSIIEGPPGTGKSSACTKLVATSLLLNGGKALIAAASNSGTDVLFDKMKKVGQEFNIVLKTMRVFSRSIENALVAAGKLDDESVLHVAVRRHSLWRSDEEMNKLIDEDEKNPGCLPKEEQDKLEGHKARIGRLILEEQDVILCTPSVACEQRVLDAVAKSQDKMFTTVVVDEAGMLDYVTGLAVLSLPTKTIALCGDTKQLGPLAVTPTSQMACYDVSIMQLLKLVPAVSNNDCVTQLKIQYRMVPAISIIANKLFYEGVLRDDESVIRRQEEEVKLKLSGFTKKNRVVVYNYGAPPSQPGLSRGKETYDSLTGDCTNQTEANVTLSVLKEMKSTGYDLNNVTVSAMYKAQVKYIRRKIAGTPDLGEVDVQTSDYLQGREKECLILNLCRSNDSNAVGFLEDPRRMNVALTRARSYLILVCDVENFERSKVAWMKDFFELLRENACIRKVKPKS